MESRDVNEETVIRDAAVTAGLDKDRVEWLVREVLDLTSFAHPT